MIESLDIEILFKKNALDERPTLEELALLESFLSVIMQEMVIQMDDSEE